MEGSVRDICVGLGKATKMLVIVAGLWVEIDIETSRIRSKSADHSNSTFSVKKSNVPSGVQCRSRTYRAAFDVEAELTERRST
jgi:hypothetical protein